MNKSPEKIHSLSTDAGIVRLSLAAERNQTLADLLPKDLENYTSHKQLADFLVSSCNKDELLFLLGEKVVQTNIKLEIVSRMRKSKTINPTEIFSIFENSEVVQVYDYDGVLVIKEPINKIGVSDLVLFRGGKTLRDRFLKIDERGNIVLEKYVGQKTLSEIRRGVSEILKTEELEREKYYDIFGNIKV